MNPATNKMLQRYAHRTVDDSVQALREIIQEVALLGLWRAKFFEHAAFYGGTALRILYGLDRFSEDLDFSLLAPGEGFNLANRKAADIDYYYPSRLPGEPAEGVADLHFHPVEPRNFRLGATWKF